MIRYRYPKYSCIGWHALVYAGMRWYAVVCVGMRLLVLPEYHTSSLIDALLYTVHMYNTDTYRCRCDNTGALTH